MSLMEETWTAPGPDRPFLDMLLAAAVAAPSYHNTQPWSFAVDRGSGSMEVRVSDERWLRRADPARRAQYLSVGAALFNLRLAAEHLGRPALVQLLPEPNDPDVLAVVRPGGAEPVLTIGEPDLYGAIARRRTSRLPFTGRPVPDAVVGRMEASAHAEGARLYVPGFAGTPRLLHLTALAQERNLASAQRTAETRAWINPPGAERPYGIPASALGPQDLAGRMPVRDFTGPLPALRPPGRRFERHPQVALLWTTHDRRVDWLRAGQALQRVLLAATAQGVRTSMLHQAMEWPDLRQAMRPSDKQWCHAQLLLRFGYGPDGAPTPRATDGAGTSAP